MNDRKLTRHERLAAEYFGYSLAHYAERVKIKNVRFTEIMPDIIKKLEQALAENWSTERIAKELELSNDAAIETFDMFRDVLDIVDSPDAATAFRRSKNTGLYLKI